jgi:hypothetical protein
MATQGNNETRSLFNVKKEKKEEEKRRDRGDKGKKEKRLYTVDSTSASLVFVSHEQRNG